MITSWMPTVAGFLAAFGLLVSQIPDHPTISLAGLLISAAGTALLGVVAKQYNVHGGTVPQATPASVEAVMLAQGVAETLVQDQKVEAEALVKDGPAGAGK